MAGHATKVPSYQVKFTLQGVRPPVWRRLLLPGQWHLGRVHDAVQVAMGWTDSHLHMFEVDGQRFGVPDAEWGEDDVRRETTVRLHEVAPEVGSRLLYTYDFGDGWEHRIVVEALGDPVTRASCLAGRRACPPEDCGGPWGYAELLAALADPAHPEHETYAEWLPDGFDPIAFDRAATDRWLAALRG